jgi:hypothetical protein
MSGLSTTPWHLTVGNPFSPILNMANIVVENVDLKFSSEMGFQDMPKRVDANITIKLSRPLGQQEINRMFNNQYGRIYSKNSTITSSLTPKTTKEADFEDTTETQSQSVSLDPAKITEQNKIAASLGMVSDNDYGKKYPNPTHPAVVKK